MEEEEQKKKLLQNALKYIDSEAGKRQKLIDEYKENPLEVWKIVSVIEQLNDSMVVSQFVQLILTIIIQDIDEKGEDRESHLDLLDGLVKILLDHKEETDETLKKVNEWFRDADILR